MGKLATRRQAIATSVTLISGAALAPAALAAMLTATARQTPGPFYPDILPLDRDNDLVQLAGTAANAQGQVTHILGRVTDTAGHALPGARIEIWQCDVQGRYIHSADARRSPRDANFQGYGQTLCDDEGRYRFRTIRPVPYGSRTPHIHFAVHAPGRPVLITQMYVAGEPRNARDGLLNRIPAAARPSVIVPLESASDIEAGALAGAFNIVLS